MRKVWSVLLVLLLLLGNAFADAGMKAFDLAIELAKEITYMENIRAASTEDIPECASWTDNRTDAKCRLAVCSDEDAADALAVAMGTRSTSARTVGCCVIALDSDLTVGALEDYTEALADILGAELQMEPDYILNVNTRKFHYPECSSVGEMKESNKQPYNGDREELILQDYKACKKCEP